MGTVSGRRLGTWADLPRVDRLQITFGAVLVWSPNGKHLGGTGVQAMAAAKMSVVGSICKDRAAYGTSRNAAD